MSIRIGHFIDSLCPFMTCKILFSSAKNNFTMLMDWLSSYSTVRNTTRQITVTDVSLLVIPIHPLLCSIYMLILICKRNLENIFIRTKNISKSPRWMTRPSQWPISDWIRTVKWEYLCLWDQCQWSCIYFNHNKLFHHPDWTHDTMWQYNFLTYM